MNIDKLRGKMAEKNKTFGECAKALNTSATTFSKKMNKQGEFSVTDINLLAVFLEMNQSEKLEIFLQQDLHSVQEIN